MLAELLNNKLQDLDMSALEPVIEPFNFNCGVCAPAGCPGWG